MYKAPAQAIATQAVKRRGVPLSAVVKSLSQSSSFSTNAPNQGGHHVDFHRTPTSQLKTKEQVYEEEQREFNAKMPKTPAFEIWLSKILGASLVFWLAYWTKESGAILVGLERPHWEHPFGDSDSEEDDDDWSDTDSDDDLELRLEYYTNDADLKQSPINRRTQL